MEPTYQRALDGVNALGKASKDINTSDAATTMDDEQWPNNAENPPMNTTTFTTSTSAATSTNINAIAAATATGSNAAATVTELSTPLLTNDESDSDTFSDRFWQDVDAELTN